jgi:hypothetical protein
MVLTPTEDHRCLWTFFHHPTQNIKCFEQRSYDTPTRLCEKKHEFTPPLVDTAGAQK